jgi:hypothetical protein
MVLAGDDGHMGDRLGREVTLDGDGPDLAGTALTHEHPAVFEHPGRSP